MTFDSDIVSPIATTISKFIQSSEKKSSKSTHFKELLNVQLLLFSRSADRAKVAFHPEFLRKILTLSAINALSDKALTIRVHFSVGPAT